MKQTYFLLVLILNIFKSCSQQCTTKYIKTYLYGKLAETDYKPLLSIEENSYGITLGKCVYQCDEDHRCIGFDICKLTDTLFRCRTCCEWWKIRGYTIVETSNCKRIEKKFEFGTNLAFNKTATLSSKFAADNNASNAVDGIKNCSFYNLTAVSKYSYQPWFSIQLDGTYNVKNVVIYSRLKYGFQADNIVVTIKGNTISHICGGGKYPGPTANNDVIAFTCPSECRGSKVLVQKTTSGYLGLCEVEVYGDP